MVEPTGSFHFADYAVFALTIFLSLLIGIYYAFSGSRQNTTAEYLLGGRHMQVLPVAISLLVSFESSIMMLGEPAEMYLYGVQVWMGNWGTFLAQLISTVVIVPLLHPLHMTSAFEYLHERFDSTAVRLLGTTLGMLGNLAYTGIVLFGPAVALEAVTGFSQWYSVFVTAIAAIIYTTIGGIKAVIWSDVFQSVVMYAGMMAILVKGTLDVGSPKLVWDIAAEGGRMNFFNFDPDPTIRHTFWSLTLGSFFRSFNLIFTQPSVQRIGCVETLRDAKLVVLIMAPLYFISLSLASYEGIIAYSYYANKGCDPYASGKISNANQIIPFMVMEMFGNLPGLPGLFIASLFSASLSTMSTTLNSLSACMWADMIQPYIGEVSEVRATAIVKVTVLFFGILSCGVALLVSLIGGPLSQITLSVMSAFAGPLTGLFLLGCFCPFANSKGAMVGGIISLIYSVWLMSGRSFSKGVKNNPHLPFPSIIHCLDNISPLKGGSPFNTSVWRNNTHHVHDFFNKSTPFPTKRVQGIDIMYSISYMWQGTIGIFLTIVIGILVSICTGGNRGKEVNPKYLISFWRHFCCCLPKSVLDFCSTSPDHCDVEKTDIVSPNAAELSVEGPVVQSNSDLTPPNEKESPTEKCADEGTDATSAMKSEVCQLAAVSPSENPSCDTDAAETETSVKSDSCLKPVIKYMNATDSCTGEKESPLKVSDGETSVPNTEVAIVILVMRNTSTQLPEEDEELL